MAGCLYLVATPIGNMEDITYRAVRILKEADLIAAEDTRNSVKILAHYDIHTPMTSYHEFNKIDKGHALVNRMLTGETVAVITDAGTPGISDPGEELVKMCYEAGIPVYAIPGPAACITAVTSSGQACRRFAFEAFLPKEKKERSEILQELQNEMRTMVIYEAPHHLKATLRELADTLGADRELTITRELTKRHEEKRITTLGEAVSYYDSTDPRGEYVLVIAGKSRLQLQQEQRDQWANVPLQEHLQQYLDQGMDRKQAMKAVAADLGVSKRDVYQKLLAEKEV